MSTTIGNLTISKDLTPHTLVEVRVKTLANHSKQISSVEPSHIIPFAELEQTFELLNRQSTVIEYAWNVLGDNSYYVIKGMAGGAVSKAASALGSMTSTAKKKSSAANGKLGGRPKKS